ncbi:MAG: hypothetical protein IKY64_04215 [Bacteroidaceae bacterium]|nr:hypothetical protein [Bacteroidaceae bacterium]
MKKNFDRQEITVYATIDGLNYLYRGGEEYWEFEISITDKQCVDKYISERSIRLTRPYVEGYSVQQLYEVRIGDTISVVYGKNDEGEWHPVRFYKPS